MVPKLRQALLSAAVVGIALGAGVLAVGVVGAPSHAELPTPGATMRTGAPSASSTVVSQSPGATADGDVAVLVGAGDIADCDQSTDELTANAVEAIPGTVFTLGDNANPEGARSTFEECYAPTWGRPSIKARTRPAVGDNEYNTAGAADYFAYFGDAAGPPDRGYYAYDAGAWRVYVLNSECSRVGGCGVGSPQATWLLEDLRTEPRSCVLAMLHKPYFTSGPSAGRSSSTRNLWRILDEARAELVLSGNDHHYERFAPQTGAGDADPDGLVQFVVGTGGSRSDDVTVPATNSLVLRTHVYGVLRLDLAPDSYAFRFISVAGPDFTDSGTGTCR